MEENDQDDVVAWLAERSSELMPLLWKSVVPLCRVENGEAHLTGTGTLLQVCDEHFLVTAAHVIEAFQAAKSSLFTIDCDQGVSPVEIECAAHCVLNRCIDIAVVALSQEVVEALPNRRFLRVHDTDRWFRQKHEGFLLIHGYPYDWVKRNANDPGMWFHPYTRIVTHWNGNSGNLDNYDEKWHFLLDHRQPKSFCPGVLKERFAQHLQGISGSSVWQIYRTGEPLDKWTLDSVRIVGVETCVYRKGKIVRATKWGGVEAILRESFPSIEKPLQIVVPELPPPDGNVQGMDGYTI